MTFSPPTPHLRPFNLASLSFTSQEFEFGTHDSNSITFGNNPQSRQFQQSKDQKKDSLRADHRQILTFQQIIAKSRQEIKEDTRIVTTIQNSSNESEFKVNRINSSSFDTVKLDKMNAIDQQCNPSQDQLNYSSRSRQYQQISVKQGNPSQFHKMDKNQLASFQKEFQNLSSNKDYKDQYRKNLKKYKSQDYNPLKDQFNVEPEQINQNKPRWLKQIMVKVHKQNIYNQNTQNIENFKATLHSIHIVPYEINNQIVPYAFSRPAELEIQRKKQQKIQSLDKQTSTIDLSPQLFRHNEAKKHHIELQKEFKEEIQCNKLYFSNYQFTALNKTQLKHKFIYQNSQNSQINRKVTIKSEPKHCIKSNLHKNSRANSIQYKSKPSISTKMAYVDESPKYYEQSQVQKIVDRNRTFQKLEDHPNSSNIVYQSNQINFCCGNTFAEESTVNKINFQIKPKVKGLLSEIENSAEKIFVYQIAPISSLKQTIQAKNALRYEQNMINQDQKKGIKIITSTIRPIYSSGQQASAIKLHPQKNRSYSQN